MRAGTAVRAAGPIAPSAATTCWREIASSCPWSTAVRAGTARAATAPIFPRALAASQRTAHSASSRASMRAGIASCAVGPICPRATTAIQREAGSWMAFSSRATAGGVGLGSSRGAAAASRLRGRARR